MRQERNKYIYMLLYTGPLPLNRDGESSNAGSHSRIPRRKLPQTPSTKTHRNHGSLTFDCICMVVSLSVNIRPPEDSAV